MGSAWSFSISRMQGVKISIHLTNLDRYYLKNFISKIVDQDLIV